MINYWKRLLLAACLAQAAIAHAGSAILAAPVKAHLTMHPAVAPVGAATVARLRLTLLDDVPHLAIAITARGCLDELGGAVPAAIEQGRKGAVVTISARFKVRQAGPCDVIAEVITVDDQRNRFGSVFGVTVNPAPASSGTHRKGVTASGEHTVEAPAAR
ncbi:hypothetical protein [Massilia sp. DWR3-1-1]|uniref:hypothetical protein n=1 Tax=Massilia sp. DWR3-1-1 TaxID=2804559 RepID=UPI003CF88DD7